MCTMEHTKKQKNTKDSSKKNRRKKRSKAGHTKDTINDINVISESISDLSLDNNIFESKNSKIKQISKQFNKDNEDFNKQLLDYDYIFKIFPSKKYVCYCFRHRNVNSKYINLKYYTNNTQTYVFKSIIPPLNSSRQTQANKFSPVKCNVQKDNVINKKNKLTKKNCKEKHTRKKRLDKQIIEENFPTHLTKIDVEEGLKIGQLNKGVIRISPKSAQYSFVSNKDTTQSDYFIKSVLDRNRALEGDEIVFKVKSETDWIDGQKTAEVVYILNEVHPRICVGLLKPLENNSEYAVLLPRDKRLPVIHIPSLSWPRGFAKKPKLYQNILFSVKILEWNMISHATGVILEQIGLCGDLKAETISILKEFCLDVSPFKINQIKDYLPQSKEIPHKEFEYREDIRSECIFTIDPLMARDLDDAVSVKILPNGHYEIGVHISDASYYLPEGSPLDSIVCKKATTIYLVDNVYHMLPVNLCLHCSLLPGEDKLAFSVFWEMDDHGQIYNTRFARTILSSCAQLAYEHAQQMIDNPDKDFTTGELPEIYNGFTSKDLINTVSVLQKIASILREGRMKNGSLRIDQIKLLFSINPCTGEPLDFMAYENKEAHRLIEEFMLLANISVAKKIYDSFPDIAFLRCHESPKYTMLLDAQRSLETCGIHIDVSSSGAISNSLKKYVTHDFQGLCRNIVLNNIFAKPMIRARYICSSTQENENNFNHYALSVPIYTHFTSPIRRYADIMVHRLLAASLGYDEKPQWSVDHVQEVANNCNIQKYNAKRAGEASSDLYLAFYVDKHQPYIQECVVTEVKDRSFDVIVIKTGSCVRVHQNKCQDQPKWKLETIPTAMLGNGSDNESNKKILRLILTYPKTKEYPEPQTTIIEMFSIVKVKLTKASNKYKLDAYMLRPTFSSQQNS